MSEGKRRAVIEQLWLTYYNDTLLAKGMITETQHSRLRLMIRRRTASVAE